jgi:hypothetical protein
MTIELQRWLTRRFWRMFTRDDPFREMVIFKEMHRPMRSSNGRRSQATCNAQATV